MIRFSCCWIILIVLFATATALPGELAAVDPAKVGFDSSKLSQVETAIQNMLTRGNWLGRGSRHQILD